MNFIGCYWVMFLISLKKIVLNDEKPTAGCKVQTFQELLLLILSLENCSNEKHKLFNACKRIKLAQFESIKSYFLVHCVLLLLHTLVGVSTLFITKMMSILYDKYIFRWYITLSFNIFCCVDGWSLTLHTSKLNWKYQFLFL